MTTVAESLDRYTRPGWLYERRSDGKIHCYACAHNCIIPEGKRGACQVRSVQGGELLVPWGYVSSMQVDPVEKKPFNHLLPGKAALTFGMLGCDFHCGFCQNWLTSQVLRDMSADYGARYVQPVTPDEIVHQALLHGAPLLVSSYNEPLITSEWAIDVFKTGRAAGLRCAYVSNGNATERVLDELRPYLTAYKVDLKSMQQSHYRALGGSLKTVQNTIRYAHSIGLWVEVVTLVIPGYNDSDADLAAEAEFLASISPDIPVHFTAFHPDYQMTDPEPTPAITLHRAAAHAQAAGLKYVYAGNLPGRVGTLEDTHCPTCAAALVERRGYHIRANRITAAGTCPKCGTVIPGIWS